MNLVALTICRNSEWCIEASLNASLRWCDSAVVLDHASADATAAILKRLQAIYGKRLTLLHEADPTWSEMRHRQRTLVAARRIGATHCAIIDDDEILTEPIAAVIRKIIGTLEPAEALLIPGLALWRSLDNYRCDNSPFGKAYVTMAFADAPLLYWQPRDHGYEHHHRAPFGVVTKRVGRQDEGGLMHFQHANWRRLIAKQQWYQMMEWQRWGKQFGAQIIRARYAPAVNETGLLLKPVPHSWWGMEKHLINLDAAPWQEADMRRMIAEKGADFFKEILENKTHHHP